VSRLNLELRPFVFRSPQPHFEVGNQAIVNQPPIVLFKAIRFSVRGLFGGAFFREADHRPIIIDLFISMDGA